MRLNYLSKIAQEIQPSPTLSVSTKAKRMQKSGVDVCNFVLGEPDFDTPEYIKKSAVCAIEDNFTRYTATQGIIELRKVICEKMLRDNGLSYEPEEVLVSPGAKSSIVNILKAVCDEGDSVIIPCPYWVSYPSQVKIAGGKPHYICTSQKDDYKLTGERLLKELDKVENPKVLILNSPCNPTGAVYTKEELLAIGEVCIKKDILILSDEIYEKLVYDGSEHFSIASISDELKKRTIIVNGVSKAYAMTGWRLGYAVGPLEIIKAANRLQGHISSCVNSITQKATITAIAEEDGSLVKMKTEFLKRRKFLVEKLNSIENVTCSVPNGAFYAFPNISYYIKNNTKGIENSLQLCEYLLEKFNIAIVAGSAFGSDANIRFSYVTDMKTIKKGLLRFEEGLLSLVS